MVLPYLIPVLTVPNDLTGSELVSALQGFIADFEALEPCSPGTVDVDPRERSKDGVGPRMRVTRDGVYLARSVSYDADDTGRFDPDFRRYDLNAAIAEFLQEARKVSLA